MIIPYASPNLGFLDTIHALFTNKAVAEEKIKNYFSTLTGKKYILLTNSCRSALYLAYLSLSINGEVITSPLTCKVAIDPIIESGNIPVFADINPGDLNIEAKDIEHRITRDTMAIQAIHLGGVSCDMNQIMSLAGKKNLLVIEDCAQALGSTYKGKHVGSFGDVSCFSLIKNAYGIGGGILATDNYEIFQKAQKINNESPKSSQVLILYRVLRNLLESKRRYFIVYCLYKFFMSIKGKRQNYHSIQNQYCRITSIEEKIAANQLNKFATLHSERKRIGKRYFELLNTLQIMHNRNFNQTESSFTKFFVYNPAIDARECLKNLADRGVEAMHLEQKHGSPFQEKLLTSSRGEQDHFLNYHKVHDCIVSLPVSEKMSERQIAKIVKILGVIIKKTL